MIDETAALWPRKRGMEVAYAVAVTLHRAMAGATGGWTSWNVRPTAGGPVAPDAAGQYPIDRWDSVAIGDRRGNHTP